MPDGLFSRIRWGNVARAAAVLALLALVLAWPRLTPEPPVVPEPGVEEVAAPVAGQPAGPPAVVAEPPPVVRAAAKPAGRQRRRRVRPRAVRRREARATKETVAPAPDRPALAPVVVPRAYAPRPRPAPPASEFGPEG